MPFTVQTQASRRIRWCIGTVCVPKSNKNILGHVGQVDSQFIKVFQKSMGAWWVTGMQQPIYTGII